MSPSLSVSVPGDAPSSRKARMDVSDFSLTDNGNHSSSRRPDHDRGETSAAGELRLAAASYDTSCGMAERVLKGEDKTTTKRCSIGGDDVLFVLVADGHGGKKSAEHCQKFLLEYVIEGAGGDAGSESLGPALRAAFVRAHKEVQSLPGCSAGSTLTVAALNWSRGECTIANVGDSYSLLVSLPSGHRMLTADHRLQTSVAEQQRVAALGGIVAHAKDRHGAPAGPLRLWPGGVAMARSIGDADCGVGIDPTPHLLTVPIPAKGMDLVTCSDGVWDALYVTDVAALAKNSNGSAQAVAELIVDTAVAKRHAYFCDGYFTPRDDTTCVFVRARPPGKTRQGDEGRGVAVAVMRPRESCCTVS